ncbi:hypothetical protein E4T48_00518 [Aureobasidium sp. EXF-10727]|nr:hypothetical protein E4T48_00518 [Aureobasidium sp. EXF-10727]KAI4726555.1 hypothetical protein E4T49_05682 [Aureobasidium sp. EXF-10728]
MEKIKKIFSPGHEKDENVMYNDPSTSSASATRDSAAPTQHAIGSNNKDTSLRQDVLDPQSNLNSRPNPTTTVSSASTIPDDVSTASIRSGVVGAGQEPRNVEGTGFTDYATSGGLSAPQQKLPVRSATPVGQSRPRPTQMETMDPSGFVNSSHAHKGLGHNYNGDPCPEDQETPVPGYIHHQHGPHGTDIANKLDPHVPGEFPSDDGLDTHQRRRDGGLASGSSGLGSDAYTTEQRAAALPGQGINTTEPTSSHHYGRDAALGAGAGAAGVGAYEYTQHQHNPTANVADPNYDPLLEQQRQERQSALDSAMAGGQRSQPDAYNTSSTLGSASTTDRSFPLSSHPTTATQSREVPSETSRDHHVGRDAALVGGGLGAAGLGAHEAGSHRRSHEIEGYEDQRFDPSAASGDKPTRIPNLMYGSSNKSSQEGQRTGALPGHSVSAAETASGLGAGAAAYESTRAGGLPRHGVNPSETASGLGAGSYESDRAGGVPSQGVSAAETASGLGAGSYESQRLPGQGVSAAETASGHSYGRDAALAGGAGVAGSQLQGYNHGGRTETDPASKTIGPHKSNLMNVIDPRVQPEPEKMKDRTTAGPHQSDMMNRADPRVDSDLSKQNEHHYGRDAALAGGAGAAGVGAYGYGKHQGQPTESIGTSAFDPRSTNTSNVVDPNHDPILEQQRLERQRAYEASLAGAGGAGAGSVGAYEHGNPQGTATQSTLGHTPFASRSVNTDPALTQQQPEHHYGRDAALAGGAAGIGAGAYEHGRHHDPTGSTVGTSTFDPRSTNTSNVVNPSTDPTLAQQQQGHHYGRDAALVGGAGAAGAGAYEYGKHRGTDNNLGTSTFDPRSTNTSNVVNPSTDPTLAQQQQGHHYGRDAALAGGAGAAGYGAYEALDPKEQEKLAKHQAHEAEKAHKAQVHEAEKAQKAQAHEAEKAKKAQAHEAEKAQKAQQHQMDKDLKHQQKEREHEIAKQEKKAEKQREKEADKSEKEAEKATKENEHPEKKKHGLLGFLHRDKKNEPEDDLRQQGRLQEADIVAHERHQRELEARAADGSIPAAGAKFEPSLEEQRANPNASSPYADIEERGHQTVSTDTAGRHRLHKEPPASVLKQQGLETDHPYGDSHGANVRIA